MVYFYVKIFIHFFLITSFSDKNFCIVLHLSDLNILGNDIGLYFSFQIRLLAKNVTTIIFLFTYNIDNDIEGRDEENRPSIFNFF